MPSLTLPPPIYSALFRNEAHKLAEMLAAKNANYGAGIFQPSSLVPKIPPKDLILTRMADKIKRLETLAEGEPDRVGESFEDTLRDLAGYILLWCVCDQVEIVTKAVNAAEKFACWTNLLDDMGLRVEAVNADYANLLGHFTEILTPPETDKDNLPNVNDSTEVFPIDQKDHDGTE